MAQEHEVWKSALAHLIYSIHYICSETNIGGVKWELNNQDRKSNENVTEK